MGSFRAIDLRRFARAAAAGSRDESIHIRRHESLALRGDASAIGLRKSLAFAATISRRENERVLEGGFLELEKIDKLTPVLLTSIRAALEEHASSESLVALFGGHDAEILGSQVQTGPDRRAVRVSPRSLFKPALALDATSLLLAHNHPSGDFRPSRADEAATATIRSHAALFGIAVIDHLIFAGDYVYSMQRGELL